MNRTGHEKKEAVQMKPMYRWLSLLLAMALVLAAAEASHRTKNLTKNLWSLLSILL